MSSDEEVGVDQRLIDGIVDGVHRDLERKGAGSLIGGVQNRVEMHFHVDDPAVAEALARLLLMGAHDVSISLKANRR